MFGWFKKEKPKKYAVAKLVDNLVDKEERAPVSPLLDRKEVYIINIGRLKQAMVSRNGNEVKCFTKFLKKNGLGEPKTLMECDELMKRVEDW
jgi:5-keto 4-deoxyuronate isomerase